MHRRPVWPRLVGIETQGFCLNQRHIGPIEPGIRIPEGIDLGKNDATFKNGILTGHLPNTPEARTASRKLV